MKNLGTFLTHVKAIDSGSTHIQGATGQWEIITHWLRVHSYTRSNRSVFKLCHNGGGELLWLQCIFVVWLNLSVKEILHILQGSQRPRKSWKTWEKNGKSIFQTWKNHGIWKKKPKSWKSHKISKYLYGKIISVLHVFSAKLSFCVGLWVIITEKQTFIRLLRHYKGNVLTPH